MSRKTPDYGDLIPEDSVFDRDPDLDDEVTDPAGGAAAPGDVGHLLRAPDTVRDWLSAIDWRQHVPAIVAAERALADLEARVRASSERSAFEERILLNEAVAQARLSGLVTTRQRVRERLLLVDETGAERERYLPVLRISPGDSLAVRALGDLQRFFDGRPSRPDDRHIAHFLLGHDGGGAGSNPGDGALEFERVCGRVSEWRTLVQTELADQPSSTTAACALWAFSGSVGPLIQEPVAAGQTLAGWLVGRTRGRYPPALSMATAFMDRPTRWRPQADPDTWLARFVDGLARAAQLAMGELSLLEHHCQEADKLTQDRRASSRLGELARLVAQRELVTATGLRRAFGWKLSDRGARKLLAQLELSGVVHEVTGRQRYRVFAHASVSRRDLYLAPERPAAEASARQAAAAQTGEQTGTQRSARSAAPGALPSSSGGAGGAGRINNADLDRLMRDAEDASRRLEDLRRRELVRGEGSDADRGNGPNGASDLYAEVASDEDDDASTP